MKSFSTKGLYLIALTALLAVPSCTEELREGMQQPQVEGAVMTKVINTPSDSEDGSLLVCLTEEAADAYAAGNKELAVELCGMDNVLSFEPVFPADAAKDEVARRHNLHRWFEIRFDGADKTLLAAELTAFASVSRVQYNKKIVPASDLKFSPYIPSAKTFASSTMPFNDPLLGDQWHYINTGNTSVANTAVEGADIAVKDAWRLTGGDPSVVVAIIDGPVMYTHPDLAANMWVNEVERDGVPGVDDDDNGYKDDIYGWNCDSNSGEISWAGSNASAHGTHVAGVVAAVNGNNTGVCGVAGGTGKGDGVRMMSCQIFAGEDESNLRSSSVAFYYAQKNGASIAQCSWGYKNASYKSDKEYGNLYSAEYDAIQFFLDKDNNNSEILDGNLIIAAAGNERNSFSSYPAALEDVISVTGIGPDYLPAVNYTNYGPGCNIAAPGGDFYVGDITDFAYNKSRVLSTFINTVKDDNLGTAGHEYAYMQGTSMACPHVSGVAALGLSYARKLGKTFSREEFVSMLLGAVNDLNDRMTGGTKFYIEDGNRVYVDLEEKYRKKMGTGVVDAWKFLMAIEGTPTLAVRVLGEDDKAERYGLEPYFGGSAADLIYLGVECDEQTRTSLGLTEDPKIEYEKLRIKPTKVGSGKVVIRAIAGDDPNKIPDGWDNIGGMEIYRTVSVMSRGVASDNGGWL